MVDQWREAATFRRLALRGQSTSNKAISFRQKAKRSATCASSRVGRFFVRGTALFHKWHTVRLAKISENAILGQAMKGLLIAKALLITIAPPAGFLGAIIEITNYVARRERGRVWLENLEKTAISLANLLGQLKVSKTVPELYKAIRKWAVILFGVTIVVGFLHSELVLTVFSLSAVFFSLGALSLHTISQPRSLLKFGVVGPILYVLVFTACVIISLRVDHNVGILLTKLAYQCGVEHPSPLAGLFIIVAMFALVMLIFHAAIVILLALLGCTFVTAIWLVVKLSAFLSRYYDRKLLNRTIEVVALTVSVVGVVAYLFL